jgi:peptide methionine sulfoxide reductase msrA/msrB
VKTLTYAVLAAIVVAALFSAAGLATLSAGSATIGNTDGGRGNMGYKKLTPDEERVILNKGTEPPFTGKYVNSHDEGTYNCKQCGAPLFKSGAKFDSKSGWPSFDEALPGAIERIPDTDGIRTEIQCANCGAHLGHVFTGEGFTDKDTRYCVNSISMDFQKRPKTEDAYFAGGCFWGVEYLMAKAPGVVLAESGYMGGTVQNPAYKQVSGGDTGHLETVHVVFDPVKTTYRDVAKLFFDIHDPTQANGQGPDIGSQYKSAVFYASDPQKKTAQELMDVLKKKGFNVVTVLRPAGTFWKAEEYHQKYYEKTGHEPYCHVKVDRFGE